MARRWKMGMLLGVLWASALPTLVQAQKPTDPVPLYQAAPSYGPGVMQASAPPGAPMHPMAGYAPGAGGPPPCPPPFAKGLMEGWDICSGELDDDCCHYYVNGGWVAMLRYPMKDYLLAVTDPVLFDDGNPPLTNRPLLNFSDVEPHMAHGGRLNVGLYSNGMCCEIGGMWLPTERSEITVEAPGRISSFFFNPPLGFEGTNPGLWDNADIMTLKLSGHLASAEINCRWFNRGYDEALECYCGVRYVDFGERMSIFTDDDSLQFPSDPLSMATYSTHARNYMMGLSAGISMHSWVFSELLAVSFDARGSWMADYAVTSISLVRGDGLVGRDGGVNKWGFSQIYEAGAFIDLTGGRCRIRGGYQCMLLYHVATAQDQLDFDLSNGNGRGDLKGTVFYHGPTVLCEFIF